MSDPLPIIVYSDVICPWCYVGKRRLEAALSDPGRPPGIPDDLRFSWRPFELNPDMPPEGIERTAYRARKFGAARSAELDRKMLETGAELGIAFAFDRMQRTPNTLAAHQLIDVAQKQGLGAPVVDALFRAYFEEARDVGDPAVLADIAARLEVKDWPGSANEKEVRTLEGSFRDLGISAVPTFVLDRRLGVSGAQPPEAIAAALREAAASMPAST
jgi:predicted DsbA family dithiol-disulfide isomerase